MGPFRQKQKLKKSKKKRRGGGASEMNLCCCCFAHNTFTTTNMLPRESLKRLSSTRKSHTLVRLALHTTTWMEVIVILFIGFPVLALAPCLLFGIQVLQDHLLCIVGDHALLSCG